MSELQKQWDSALAAGDLTALRALIQNEPRLAIVEPERSFDWPLHVAARAGDFELTERLLASEAPVNVLDENGQTPLFIAAVAGHRAVCARLREQGATADFATDVSADNFRMPFYDAADRNNLEALSVLAECGGNINDENGFGDTALSQSVKDGNIATAHLLVTMGADVASWRDLEDDGTLLHCVVTCSRDFTAEQEHLCVRLVEAGLDVEATDEDGLTPLHAAVLRGNVGAVTWLLDHGARLDAQAGNNKFSPLHFAAAPDPVMRFVCPDKDQEEDYSVRVIRLLLKHGLEIDIADSKARTPLHYAAMSARPILVAFLLERGSDPRSLDSDGYTPLDLLLQQDDNPTFDTRSGKQVAETVRVLSTALTRQ